MIRPTIMIGAALLGPALAAILLLFAHAQAQPSRAGEFVPGSNVPAALAPKPDLLDDICEVIDQIIAELEGIDTAVQNDPEIGPETEELIREDLEAIEDFIDDIQTPSVYPDLNPPDAGMPGQEPIFASIGDAIDQCQDWATEALAEGRAAHPSHAVIGNRLDSIKLALPQLRTFAGIN